MISRIHLRNAISRPACLGARHQAHSSGTTSTCLIAMIGGTKSLASAVEQIPGRTLIEINKKVSFRLLTKAGTTGVFNLGRMVPIAGAPILATVDGLSCRAVGGYARSAFPRADR
jgi:hypothetical protein